MRERYARGPAPVHLLLAMLLSTSVAAQQESGVADLDEVIVSAERRHASLQDVPVAVTALSAEDLQNERIFDLRDIAAVTPGLSIGGAAGFNNNPIAIRGIGSSVGGIGADDPVAIYVDGVYIGRPAGFVSELVDVERIEVLRGPQGTLYGRNATGGAINVITRRPTVDPSVYGGAILGNYELRKFRSSVNLPLGGHGGAMRLAGVYSDRDGYGFDTVNGVEANEEDTWALQGALSVGAKETLQALVTADYSSLEGSEYFQETRNGIGDREVFASEIRPFNERDRYGAALNLSRELGIGDLRSISAYRRSEWHTLLDPDGQLIRFINNNASEAQRQWSQEFQLASTGEGTTEWIAGLYYFREESVVDRVVSIFAASTTRTGHMTNETDSYAAFGQGTYRFGERYSLTAGLRYSHEAKDFSVVEAVTAPAPSIPFSQLDDSWDAWTPRLVLQADWAPADLMTYLSFSRGYKSGGFNFTSNQPAFDPELVSSYELGAKYRTPKRMLTANAAAFYYDYEDLQVRIPVGLGLIEIRNAAQAEIYGLELEAELQPASRLSLDASVSYLHATYDEFQQGTLDLSGNRLNRAPSWKYNVGAEFTSGASSWGSLTGRLSYRGETESFYTELNNPLFGNDGWESVDARLAFDSPSGRWQVAAFGKNLTDEVYRSHVIPIGPFAVTSLNEPPTYGVEFSFRYE